MPTFQDKATSKWYCKFYYVDYNGNKKQKKKMGFDLKREALAWEREFITSASFQPDMSFTAFYELFCKDTNPRLKEHTIQTARYRAKNHLLPFFGNMPLSSITATIVIKWQNNLITKGYSDIYLNSLHRALSTVFNHACKFYGLKENPAKKAGSIGSKKSSLTLNYWTLTEFNTVIATIEDIKAKTAITLLYWSGIRKGELLALTWKDLDFNNNKITINKSLQRINGKEIITSPKTLKSNRIIALPNQAIKILKEYKECVYDPSGAIFAWEKRFIEKAIIEACEITGTKRIRVHDIRHSHASHLIELGFSPLLIAQRLGHEKIETTLNTYAHLWPNKENEMIEALNKENDQKGTKKVLKKVKTIKK